MAENETLFREVNERVADTAAHYVGADDTSTHEYFCECANADCTFRVTLTGAQYASVRADPKQFVVLPLHFTPEVETLVAKNEGHWLVRKIGEAGEYVEKLDPRARYPSDREPYPAAFPYSPEPWFRFCVKPRPAAPLTWATPPDRARARSSTSEPIRPSRPRRNVLQEGECGERC